MSIKFLSANECTIFLHFLNREAFEACKSDANIESITEAMEILSVCHCSGMVVNISQMLEVSECNSRLLNEVMFLSQNKMLVLLSQAASIDQFVSSRQDLYSHDAERYEIYFTDKARIIEKFRIGQSNPFSTTEALFQQILGWKLRDLNDPIRVAMSGADAAVLEPNIDAIQKITFDEVGRAVTKSIYKNRSNEYGFSPTILSAIARMISGIYINKYMAFNKAVTCTGIDGLENYDKFGRFPFYDIPILRASLDSLGYFRLRKINPAIVDERSAYYNSQEHIAFVGALGTLIDCLHRSESAPVPLGRQKIIAMITTAICATRERKAKSLSKFFQDSTDRIILSATRLSEINPIFSDRWRRYMENPPVKKKKILLLTATNVEDDQLSLALKEIGVVECGSVAAKSVIARKFISEIPLEIFHVRSSAGSGGSSGSSLVTADAVQHLNPDYVISVGICFGTKKDKQNLCDVVVATEIQDYDHGRATNGNFSMRGQKIPAGDLLLSACRRLRQEGENIHDGLVASGDKLVDDQTFVEFLLNHVPDAIAGEMEAAGISSCCSREKKEWVMIKAICDWGFDKDKKHQPEAARNAARFACRLVNLIAEVDG